MERFPTSSYTGVKTVKNGAVILAHRLHVCRYYKWGRLLWSAGRRCRNE